MKYSQLYRLLPGKNLAKRILNEFKEAASHT
jgi:hypothetical protein